VVQILKGVPPPVEFGVLLKRPIEVWVPAILACLTLQGHELGMHGPQDVDRALVTSLCESAYPFSLEDNLGRPGLGRTALRELGGPLSSGLSSLCLSGLSHLSRPRHSSDLLSLGELDLPSAFLPRLILE
jgi:hypothetical protein